MFSVVRAMALSRICRSSELITVICNGSSYSGLAYVRCPGANIIPKYSTAAKNGVTASKPTGAPGALPKANTSQGNNISDTASLSGKTNFLDSHQPLSKRERLKIIVKDYGRTVLVFHVAISLLSLGIFYTIVSRGLDIAPYVEFISSPFGKTENEKFKEEDAQLVKAIMSEGSTFLIAYGVHKLFAPLRIGITLGVTPILVKFLRRKGILKHPKKSAAASQATG